MKISWPVLKLSGGTLGAVAALAVISLTASDVAAQNFFVPPGGVGTWNDTANWTSGHLPEPGETAIIHASREATIDIVNPTSFAFLRIADNDTGAVDGKLNILPGAGLSITGQVILGAGGSSNN